MKYDVESLKDIFLAHHEEFIKNNEKIRQEFPDGKNSHDDFSIALALHHICVEILKLKGK